MPVTQQNREIEILSQLGDDVLLLKSMTMNEELGRLFTIDMEVLSKENIKFEDLLGQNVTIRFNLGGDKKRFFNGYAGNISQVSDAGHYARYHVSVFPWLWFLTRTTDCRIFQKKTVPQIIKQIFSEYDYAYVKDKLNGTYREWEYCVQYRETDFNFVSRLMEQEGIYYYFTHEQGKHTLILADAYGSHETIAGCEKIIYLPPDKVALRDEHCISDWNLRKQLQPGSYALNDYDFIHPKADLKVNSSISKEHTEAKHEIYDYPGEYVKADDGENYARTRIQELHAQYEQANGQSIVRGLCCGGLFSLGEYPREDQNREYLVTYVSHTIRVDSFEAEDGGGGAAYSNNFTVIESNTPFRPARITPKPVMQGPQTAIVVGPSGEEIHTDEHGRIKLQFHWDRYGKKDENSSCWVRVSHPWAGKGWGSIAIPRIGQEVIVDFLEGDPDRPIVTGRVYNADVRAPYPLPAGAVVSGIKSNTHKGKGYNEISMDDTAGKEKITIHGQYDMNTTVEHDQTNTVKNDFTETIKKNAKIEITEGTYNHDVKTGTATYHVKSALTENYDATQSTTVKQDITIVSTGGPIAISSDTQHVYINAGTNIQLHVGSSMIWMDKGGQINISGVNVIINGSESVNIKGGSVRSEAVAEHETKGAIVKSEGSSTNTVKGGMVMLNP